MASPAVQLGGVWSCGGLYRTMGERGTGQIAGILKIDNVGAPGRVYLHTADGTLIDFARPGMDGTFSFIGLWPGQYRLVGEDDMLTARRGKVDHVIVVAPP